MRFEFATANRIIFGPGTLQEVGQIAAVLGRHALVVTGRNTSRAAPLLKLLEKTEGIRSVATYPIDSEPTTQQIENAIKSARLAGCDLAIGFGGGSAIDASKAIAAMLTNEGHLLDYLEVIGHGRTISKPSAPCIAIPTTAGTGAEVTRNAVLTSPDHKFKASLRSQFLLPRIAVVDPELTYDLPPAVTARTGLDALTQLIEPYVSCRANPITDTLCVEGISRIARSLRVAFGDGQNRLARQDMALASLLGGLALANAGLGAVHGFAAPIGGMFAAPHGAVCAALLPHVMAANLRALRTRAPLSEALRRYEQIGRLVTANPLATADDGVCWVSELVKELAIPRLSAYGVSNEHVELLVDKALKASSMKANPIALTATELADVLRAAL